MCTAVAQRGVYSIYKLTFIISNNKFHTGIRFINTTDAAITSHRNQFLAHAPACGMQASSTHP